MIKIQFPLLFIRFNCPVLNNVFYSTRVVFQSYVFVVINELCVSTCQIYHRGQTLSALIFGIQPLRRKRPTNYAVGWDWLNQKRNPICWGSMRASIHRERGQRTFCWGGFRVRVGCSYKRPYYGWEEFHPRGLFIWNCSGSLVRTTCSDFVHQNWWLWFTISTKGRMGYCISSDCGINVDPSALWPTRIPYRESILGMTGPAIIQ